MTRIPDRIPQFVVYSDLPQTKKKYVACMQPRRVAAMSVGMVRDLPLVSYHFLFHPGPPRKAGRIFHSVQGYDGARNDFLEVHD